MALFGLFGGRSESSQLEKLAARAGNKRIQAVDRWEAIQALAKLGTPEAVEGLLPRFRFYIEPSITDQDEKQAAYEAVVAAGRNAVAPVNAFLRKTDSISWPLKILERLVAPEEVVQSLLDLLAGMDTEYERDPEKKIQVLTALEERRDARIADAVARFLEDTNETVRFHAVGTVLAQAEAEQHGDALLACLLAEDSVRVRNRVLEGAAALAVTLGDHEEAVRELLPAGYAIDPKKHVLTRK